MRQSEQRRVLVLGYGEMGHAMESVLATRHVLQIWQRRPVSGQVPIDLEQHASESDFVLFCLPATAHAALAARLAPCIRDKSTICLTIAKGLADDGRLPVEVLADTCGQSHTAVLYGPMIAEEIRAGRAGFAGCGASDAALRERVSQLFSGSPLVVEPSADVAGLSWSAILKNVYAMVFGMADELALGDNVRGLLSVAALSEMSQIVQSLGGSAATVYHLAGLGDLVTTATSAGSRHHAIGQQLARGTNTGLACEGLHTLSILRQHPRFDSRPFALFQLIDRCASHPQEVRSQLYDWLRTPFKPHRRQN